MKILASLLLLAAAVLPSAASAQENLSRSQTNPLDLASDQVFDLKEFRCWDAVTMGEQDRAFTMVLLYGHVMGEKAKTDISAQQIQVAIVNTMQACVDTPDAIVLDVLKSKLQWDQPS